MPEGSCLNAKYSTDHTADRKISAKQSVSNAAHSGRIPRAVRRFPCGRGAGFYTQQGPYAVKGCRISETEHPMGGGVPAVGAAHRTCPAGGGRKHPQRSNCDLSGTLHRMEDLWRGDRDGPARRCLWFQVLRQQSASHHSSRGRPGYVAAPPASAVRGQLPRRCGVGAFS